MHDLYRILGVSEDDVDIDLRYRIIYILHEGILDLSEAWIHRPILERFRDYTDRPVFKSLFYLHDLISLYTRVPSQGGNGEYADCKSRFLAP